MSVQSITSPARPLRMYYEGIKTFSLASRDECQSSSYRTASERSSVAFMLAWPLTKGRVTKSKALRLYQSPMF